MLGLFGDVTTLAEPAIEFIGFESVDCTGVGNDPFGSKSTMLVPGLCINIANNFSFKLKPVESCGEDQRAKVSVYYGTDCDDLANVHQPTDVNEDECYDGNIYSARFECDDVDDDAILESELKAK